MGFRVIEGGLLTTVQDLGRVGFQRYGISVSGALDRAALTVANFLVGNPASEAGLELTLSGAVLEFTAANVIATTGADMGAELNGMILPPYRDVPVRAGDLLKFGLARSGCRAYLAFAGGLDLPLVMGSRSTNLKCGLGGYEGRALRAGDVLSFATPRENLRRLGSRVMKAPPPTTSFSLRAVPGPQAERFGAAGLAAFYANAYALGARSDRMGCSLDGPPIECGEGTDIISDGIPLGAVQLPSDGKPLVLLADRQTCGGYAKIATVISLDIGALAQAKPGDAVSFVRISVEEARKAFRDEKKRLEKLRRKLSA